MRTAFFARGFTDKDATRRLANKMMGADARLRREGVIDTALESINEQSQRDIASHLIDYKAKRIAANRGKKHIDGTTNYINAIINECKFTKAGDINADGVNHFASELSKTKSARTVQAYLTAIKGFTRWLMATHKLVHDPLVSVQKPNPKTDRKHERRMLLLDEWNWLRSVTINNGLVRYNMTAQERVPLYAVAIQTGLRAGELRSLKRGQLYLTTNNPYITCKATATKNGKEARQYIKPDLGVELREYMRTKAPAATVFPMPKEWDVASMLRDDLAAARAEWVKASQHNPETYEKRHQSDFLTVVNHDGHALDFHSLRHTCGAWLAMTGAHPKAMQSVMRHSTITLTMDTNEHLWAHAPRPRG